MSNNRKLFYTAIAALIIGIVFAIIFFVVIPTIGIKNTILAGIVLVSGLVLLFTIFRRS